MRRQVWRVPGVARYAHVTGTTPRRTQGPRWPLLRPPSSEREVCGTVEVRAGVIPTPYGGVPPEPLPCPAWGDERPEDRGWVRGALNTHTHCKWIIRRAEVAWILGRGLRISYCITISATPHWSLHRAVYEQP